MKSSANNSDINEEYDSILSTLFASCDSSGSGSISIHEFEDLCVHLNLTHHAEVLKYQMFNCTKRDKLEYVDFRDGLVSFIVSNGQMSDQDNAVEHVNSEDSYNNSSFEKNYSSEDECWTQYNNNQPLHVTPKRTNRPRRKYGRKTEPEKDMFHDIENVKPEENTICSRPKPLVTNLIKDSPAPPTSKYLTPSYSPTRCKTNKRPEPEIFTGDGDDDAWKKLDSSWNEIENGSPVQENDTNKWLREVWMSVVGDEHTSMNKEQLGELMKSVGLPVSTDGEQLNDLFNFLLKDENGLIPFKQFSEEMMSFICDGTDKVSEIPTAECKTVQHSTPIDLNCPDVEMTSPTATKTVDDTSPGNSPSSIVSDISDLCPTVERVDPGNLAAVNRRRRRRATKITKGGDRMKNKNNSLPKYHPIKKRQLNNSPLSYLVNNNERYVSIDTLKQYWEEEGLDNTNDILLALQVPEHETSLSIEALTEVFEDEISNNLSIKAVAALLKQGVRYYKRNWEEMGSNTESEEAKSSLDSETLLEIERLHEQYNTSKEELNRYIEINEQLLKELDQMTKSLEFKTSHETEIFEELTVLSNKLIETNEKNDTLQKKLQESDSHMKKLSFTLRRSVKQIESLKVETEHHRQRADEFYNLHQKYLQKDITACDDILQEIRDCESFLPPT